jgi:hypothetical protein
MAYNTTLKQDTNLTQDHGEYIRPRYGDHPRRRATKETEKTTTPSQKRKRQNYQKLKIKTQITMGEGKHKASLLLKQS